MSNDTHSSEEYRESEALNFFSISVCARSASESRLPALSANEQMVPPVRMIRMLWGFFNLIFLLIFLMLVGDWGVRGVLVFCFGIFGFDL